MLLESLKKTLEYNAQKVYKKNKSQIIDIILFGSITKGKEKPKDVDIVIVFKDKKNLDISYELRKSLEKNIKISVEVNSKVYSELFETNFQAREAILVEGYSLLNKINLANGFGFKSMTMFVYKLINKTKSERMRFYYSLYGRNTEGILKKLKAIKYTDTVILVPIENKEIMKEYLDNWNIEFKETSLLLPVRLI